MDAIDGVLVIDNTNTNNPVLTGKGQWDLSNCNLDLGEDCYVSPFVKTPDPSHTNSFSADNFYLQQLDLSMEENDASVCWNKPNPVPFALMHCRLRIGTDEGCTTVTWVTNNVAGLDVEAISTNGWSWIQLESYPNSANYSVVSQWTETWE